MAWRSMMEARRRAGTGDPEHGAIAIIAVAMMFIIFGLLALSVDSGFLFMRERDLQASVDAAAMAAVTAADEDEAWERADTFLDLNGIDGYTITRLERGGYTADASLPVGERFDPDATEVNAISLAVSVEEPTFFARFFGAGGERRLAASAVAHSESVGGLAVSAPPLTIEVDIANALLSGQTDADIDLDFNDYEALRQVRINVYDMLDSVADQLGLADATYESIIGDPVDLATFATAMMEAVDAIPDEQLTGWESRSRSALDDFRDEVEDEDGSVTLSDVIAFDSSVGRRPVGSGGSLTAINVPLYNMMLMSNAGSSTASVSLGPVLGLNNVLEENIYFAMGATAGEPMLVIGEAGASVRSPGVRVLIETRLLANLGNFLGLQPITLPVTLELGSSEAELETIRCSNDPDDDVLDVNASVGMSRLLIKDIDAATLGDFSSDLPTAPAQILDLLGLGGITASVDAELTGATEVSFAISGEEIADHEIVTVVGDTMRGNLVSNAQRSLDVDVNLLWATGNVPNGIRGQINGTLAQINQDLDAIYSVLPGVSIGRMDLMGLGATCRTTLVQ